MRICGGKYKGRRFTPPARNWPTRPTTDRARESLFNILHNRLDFESTRMLDLFSGTGAHGIEIISRGCCDVTAVDKFPPAINFLRAISSEWGFEECIRLIKKDAAKFIRDFKGKPFDYVFAGPPYPLPWLEDIPNRLFTSAIPQQGCLFVLEHNPNHDFSEHDQFTEVRAYGDTRFSFFTT